MVISVADPELSSPASEDPGTPVPRGGGLGNDRRAGIRGRGDDGGRSRSRRRSNRGRTSGHGGAGGQDWGWIDKHRRGGHSRVDVPGMEELVVAGMAGLRTSSQSGQQSDGDLVVEMHLVDIVR